jgi:DNA-binding NtrC family response regulator
MFIAPHVLAGKRVLIVEDDMIMALVVEDFLLECGCITVGPCANVAKALQAVGSEVFDLAVLDVNLAGETVYPVAHALAERRIPFLLTSGYGDQAIPAAHGDWKVCAKPFSGQDLVTKLSGLLGSTGPSIRSEGQTAQA